MGKPWHHHVEPPPFEEEAAMIAGLDWYEERIEVGVRDVVKVLRDNGVNTVSACHHDMTIQCEYPLDGMLSDIHNLLYNHFLATGEEVSFTVTVHHGVEKGYHSPPTHAEIQLVRKKVDKISPIT